MLSGWSSYMARHSVVGIDKSETMALSTSSANVDWYVVGSQKTCNSRGHQVEYDEFRRFENEPSLQWNVFLRIRQDYIERTGSSDEGGRFIGIKGTSGAAQLH